MAKFCSFMLMFFFCQTTALALETIKVAAIFSKSGEAMVISSEHLMAVRFAVAEINGSGGVLGRQIELVEFDNQSTALGAKNAALKAVDRHVVAVVGGSWSSHALSMAAVFQKAGIPMITPTSTNPKVTQAGSFIFRVCFTDTFQGEMLARFAHTDLNARKVVVLTNVDQMYAIDLSRRFISCFSLLGNVIAAELDYTENLTQYKALIKALAAHDFDAVILPSYTRDAARIIKTAREAGIHQVFLGGDGWSSHTMSNYAGRELNNSYYLTHWHKDLKDQRSVRFVKKIVGKFGQSKLHAGVALSYDMICLLADALKRAGSAKSGKIRDALAQTHDFIGVTGRIRFDENRNPIKPAVILKFENGESKLVKQIPPNRSSVETTNKD